MLSRCDDCGKRNWAHISREVALETLWRHGGIGDDRDAISRVLGDVVEFWNCRHCGAVGFVAWVPA